MGSRLGAPYACRTAETKQTQTIVRDWRDISWPDFKNVLHRVFLRKGRVLPIEGCYREPWRIRHRMIRPDPENRAMRARTCKSSDRFRSRIGPLTRRRGARITPFHGPPEGGFFRSPCRGLEFMSQSASAKGPHAKADAISSPPQSAVMPTYARQDVVFERGEGRWLTSTTGERYLDFGSGVAVNALGHAHPALVAALSRAGPASCGTPPTSIASPGRNAWPSGCAPQRSPTRSSSAIRARRPARAPSSWRAAITM